MRSPFPLSTRLLTAATAAALAVGCNDATLADPNQPTVVRTVVQTTPRTVDIVQGETFTIEAWREWSDGTRSGPSLDIFSLPTGLVQVGPIVEESERTTITVRGLEPLQTSLTLTIGGVPLADGVPVNVREAGVEILSAPEIFEDEGEKRMVVIPAEQGQTFSVGAFATNDLGCPVAGGANVVVPSVSGDQTGVNISTPVVGRTVSTPGCPEAADAAVDQEFSWESSTPRIGFNFALPGVAEPIAQLHVATLDDRYAPLTAESGLQLTGTITRTGTTCGAFEPGTFDLSAILQSDETNGLRILNPDGSEFQGNEAPLGTWTFTSPARSLGNGFSVRETISAGKIRYSRSPDGGIWSGWKGTTRIDYFNEGTGLKVCDETAQHFASARIPRFGFRFRF